MVVVARNSMVRRGEGSLHLSEGGGTAWGGLNAHHTVFGDSGFPGQFGAPGKLLWIQTGSLHRSASSSVPGEPSALPCSFA